MPHRFPSRIRSAVGLTALSLVALACSGGGSTMPSVSAPIVAGPTKPAAATATPGAPTQRGATAAPDSAAPASAAARISLDCADHQPAVDKTSDLPVARRRRQWGTDSANTSSPATNSGSRSAKPPRTTKRWRRTASTSRTGSETGPEAVLGVGEKAVAFYGVGRPTAALLAIQNGTTVELDCSMDGLERRRQISGSSSTWRGPCSRVARPDARRRSRRPGPDSGRTRSPSSSWSRS